MALAPSRTVCILNSTRGTVVGEHITIAETLVSRIVGLLDKSFLPPDCGLLIHPSQGVHTLGMRFPIDVIFLDRKLQVLDVKRFLKPWRMTGLNFRAASVLELPAGTIDKSLTEVDDRLVLEERHN